MIALKRELSAQIIRQCLKEFPNEACGVLAGINGKVDRVYEMTNVDKSPESYFMDAKEQFKAMKDMRALGLDMAGIYHSHVASPAYPSSRDVELAFYPEASYVIISFKDKNKAEIRSFKIKDGKITEELVRVE